MRENVAMRHMPLSGSCAPLLMSLARDMLHRPERYTPLQGKCTPFPDDTSKGMMDARGAI